MFYLPDQERYSVPGILSYRVLQLRRLLPQGFSLDWKGGRRDEREQDEEGDEASHNGGEKGGTEGRGEEQAAASSRTGRRDRKGRRKSVWQSDGSEGTGTSGQMGAQGPSAADYQSPRGEGVDRWEKRRGETDGTGWQGGRDIEERALDKQWRTCSFPLVIVFE